MRVTREASSAAYDNEAVTATGEVHVDHVTGLTSAQVAERVARGQVNEVGERTSRSIGEIIRANVLTRLSLVSATGKFA